MFSIVPAFIFKYIEGWTALDAFYFTIITLTTIGFGDLTPTADFTMNQTNPDGQSGSQTSAFWRSSSFSVVYRIICLLWAQF